MADYFLGALKEIERRAQNNILVFSDVLSERLNVIAQNMVSNPISDNDYLKLFEMYYKKFSKEENKQAMLFCLLRMQQVAFYKENEACQGTVKKIEFNEEYDSTTKVFLSRKRNYFQNTLNHILQRFIVLDSLAYMFLLILFVLVFHASFKISCILLLICWCVILFLAKKYGVQYFFDSQIASLSQGVDRVLIQVDQSVFSQVG